MTGFRFYRVLPEGLRVYTFQLPTWIVAGLALGEFDCWYAFIGFVRDHERALARDSS